ncbi:MAG: S-methyl-5-thioribose-1-phosphate isomerase [Betaproteobacteria bacterium HGW-Betaproteobacteria-1]|nr:MAG: S-methyl-5-thioribose-1-phosphate isomerase [Betaproteobacteria bacterium HGW-Betaproteobacteria-1]
MKVAGEHYRTIWPEAGGQVNGSQMVAIIDQTQLPHRFQTLRVDNVAGMVNAIKTMQVRGAPLIGAAAAYGMALAANADAGEPALKQAAHELLTSRPTAVNLAWAVDRMLQVLLALPESERSASAWREAAAICDEDVAINQAIGQHGLAMLRPMAETLKRPLNILTHCNAGWLATVDWGTALSPIYAAHDAGLPLHVWVDETRPRNQGASLTAWELQQHGVPHTVISDNAGGHLMQHGQVDCVIVGADRVTASGDVCNKIGTYLKALAAFDNRVPFYAAVPTPTIDWSMTDGLREIPIEERDADEVAYMTGMAADGSMQTVRVIPAGSAAANPAFDVTPARLMTGIITERGICPPGELQRMIKESNP